MKTRYEKDVENMYYAWLSLHQATSNVIDSRQVVSSVKDVIMMWREIINQQIKDEGKTKVEKHLGILEI